MSSDLHDGHVGVVEVAKVGPKKHVLRSAVQEQATGVRGVPSHGQASTDTTIMGLSTAVALPPLRLSIPHRLLLCRGYAWLLD